MTALLNPRLWIALAIAAALGYSAWWLHYTGYQAGKTEVQALWDADRAAIAQQSLERARQVSRATDAAQAQADQQLEDKNAKIRALDAAVSGLLASLHNRPDRPDASGGDLPHAASAAPAASCTGADLYRSDSEFLAWEAARADQLRLDLGQCQAAYNTAREALRR